MAKKSLGPGGNQDFHASGGDNTIYDVNPSYWKISCEKGVGKKGQDMYKKFLMTYPTR